MIIYSRVVDQPATEPVTLSEAKVHLEYTGTAKDSFINSLIKTARQICETYSGLSFITQQRIIKLDAFPIGINAIEVPYGPIQSIDSFTYTDSDGNTITLDENLDFMLDNHSGISRLYALNSDGEITSWFTDVKRIPQAVSVLYTSGYDTLVNEPLPEIAKQAILLQVGSMFENRQDEVSGTINTINWNSMTILDSIKVTWSAKIV